MSEIMLTVFTDSEVEKKAQEYFETLGLDMNNAINIFLQQTVQQKNFPYQIPPGSKVERIPRKELMGCMRGQYKMSDDFDDPLDFISDYM